MKARVAMTGGVACGKSTVAEMLSRRGWRVIETDRLAHRAYEPGTAVYQNIVDVFGEGVLNEDGSVNRALLGDIVFSNPDKLGRLNAIVHPWVRAEWRNQLDTHHRENPGQPSIVVIPLLFETGAEGFFDRIIGVGCPESLQRERLRSRGLDDGKIERRIGAQLPLEKKLNLTHMVIWNSGDLAFLERQVIAASELLS
ncbi:MAG: dephospho-CoA kinase [Candidatus Methylacidiphilales bacterium]